MATTTSPKAHSTRRPPSSPSPTTAPVLPRTTSARAAASPRIATFNAPNTRRPLSKAGLPTQIPNGDARDALSASLKHETDQKEQLLLQLQDKEQLIGNYVTENDNLTSALSSAESRLNDLYAEQSRWEAELAQRIDIAEKLRDQVRELEKEKRDVTRRYNEQTATFDAERQAFYDNEQHLKSRIQSLTQARKRAESLVSPIERREDNLLHDEEAFKPPNSPDLKPQEDPQEDASHHRQDFTDPDNEPAEMTGLRLELSTLSTSYASLQSTLILMQSQLFDLKRVNQELQEENESYMILLREKTLSGRFDISRQVAVSDSEDEDAFTDVASTRSRSRSVLDVVEEEPSDSLAAELNSVNADLDLPDTDMQSTSRNSRNPRKRTTSSHAPRGESLADLPITGPGLDLAAELGRAENKDILEGDAIEERPAQPAKKRKGTISHSESAGLSEAGLSSTEVETLRNEVKSLKDANKALSLYASKIIDRIIAQEGFEHVLAVDYDKEPPTPSTAVPSNASKGLPPTTQPKQRPQSVIVGRSNSAPGSGATSTVNVPSPVKPSQKTQRRSMSFDWKGFSLFADKKPDPPPNLRPLTLKPGSSSVVTARKLDTLEDEEDRKERERLHATMKLMGIQPPAQSPLPPPSPVIERSVTAPASTSNAKANRRLSLFGPSKTTTDTSDASSVHSTSSSLGHFSKDEGSNMFGLTHEALEHVEAENSLAALDARERDLSVEIAKGASGGFTEIVPRASRRGGRRSAGGSGSGSTVWSAGMSGKEDD